MLAHAKAVNQKLRGHYGYYGVTFNGRSLNLYYLQARRLLHKWLNRRGGKTNKWNWEKYDMLVSKCGEEEGNDLLYPEIKTYDIGKSDLET